MRELKRSSFITGSYDRTCKVWDTNLGEELFTLEGHKNVVYTVAFNNPFGFLLIFIVFSLFYRDKIVTGSFDKTAKVTRNLNNFFERQLF